MTDEDGIVISARDRAEIGKRVDLKEEESGALFYVPVGDKGWYLAAVPEKYDPENHTGYCLFTMLAAAGICTLLSMAAAYFISGD